MIALNGTANTHDPRYDYNDDFSRVSASMLRKFLSGRRKYEALYVTKRLCPERPTKRMDRGAVIHKCILDQCALDDIVCVYPPEVLNRNGGLVRTRVDKFEAEHKDNYQFFMKSHELSECRAILNSIKEHDTYSWLMHDFCQRRQPIFWTDPATGLACRMRPDFLIERTEGVYLFDLKVTSNYTVDEFSTYLCGNRRGGQRGWLQMAHYTNGIHAAFGKPALLRLICVNPDSPYEVRVHRVATQTMDECLPKYSDAMHALARCQETGNFADPEETQDNVVVMNQWEIC